LRTDAISLRAFTSAIPAVGSTVWSLPDAEKPACEDRTLTCNRSYHCGELCWNTSLSIGDGSRAAAVADAKRLGAEEKRHD